jgi:hypothetical protein
MLFFSQKVMIITLTPGFFSLKEHGPGVCIGFDCLAYIHVDLFYLHTLLVCTQMLTG